MAETEDEILTTEEAAKYLKISAQSLRKLDIPRMQSNTIIRYNLKDLDAYFEAHKTEGSMRGSEWLRIVSRLEKEAGRIKYGNVGVSVQIHKGEVCKVRFTRQECEAFPMDGENEGEEK